MGFFDLNIPYPECSPSANATAEAARTKLVVKAMELGYTGVAYNRMIKGVMSDRHRCSITLPVFSSLLKLAPSLSSSVNLHRDLLGIPQSTPFRQYTRLTYCVENPSQAQVLNSGNPILKTYNLVAVRPLNQTVFDQACERMEVDIIAIDFSGKLPFRLKQPMVKAAIERGVYFEITYSDIVADVQARRQMISNAKLLVEWTRGKNLILSSSAPSVNELRGPYDVANLSLLLGLSMERAIAAISKNCRNLLENALRKKLFHREAIRVELMPSNEISDSKDAWPRELLNWDPISSGEGDILLDEMAKSFAAASCKASKTPKAIDFTSAIDSMPSHGFQVKDLISAGKDVSLLPNKNEPFPAADVIDLTVAHKRSAAKPHRLDVHPELNHASLSNAPAACQTFSFEGFHDTNRPCKITEALTNLGETHIPPTTPELELNHPTSLDANCGLVKAKTPDSQSDQCTTNCESFSLLDQEKDLHASCTDQNLGYTYDNAGKVELSPPSTQGDKNSEDSHQLGNVQVDETDETIQEVDIKNKEGTLLALDDMCKFKNSREGEQFSEHGKAGALTLHLLEKSYHPAQSDDDPMERDDSSSVAIHKSPVKLLEEEQLPSLQTKQLPLQEHSDVMQMGNNASVIIHKSPEIVMEERALGEAITQVDQAAAVQSISGKCRIKRRSPYVPRMLPFKRLWSPLSFKKKGKKIKRRAKEI